MTYQARLDSVIHGLRNELQKAMAKHRAMISPHEGRSVIREECDELWSHVMADTGDSLEARKEALQVAAMGVRYACDVSGQSLAYALERVATEVGRRFESLNSPHEGHAHLMDSYAALFSRVASGAGRGAHAADYAIALAAGAVRYVLDLCADPANVAPYQGDSGDEHTFNSKRKHP
jgi:hypothetical protein